MNDTVMTRRPPRAGRAPLPPLTVEQRRAAAESATRARVVRAEVRHRLKLSTVDIGAVIAAGRGTDGDGPVIGRMRVVALLEAMPRVGPIRAREIMDRLGIAETRRVRGLGRHQIAALQQEFDR